MADVAIELPEWSRREPEPGSPLAGRSLSPADRAVARHLTDNGKLEVLEWVHGLEIRATSWVGRVVLGDLSITVQPKVTGAPLLELLRYAYGLRHLDLLQDARYGTSEKSFQDLICHQLASEVRELIAHGLHREYEPAAEQLTSPRGRLDFPEFIQNASAASATLPCDYHPRTQSTLLNGVLLAGLRLAAGVCNDLELRGRIRRLEPGHSAPPMA